MRNLANLTAFVVDDEEVELFLAQRILLIKELAATVKTFRTGKALISALNNDEQMPDYVLLNYRMNGENGLDILKTLHKTNLRRSEALPYFILTSSTIDLSDLNSIENDKYIDGFINKPIIPQKLKQILTSLLES